MFTSKKSQYLNGQFEKISPITNIDSLYFEQAIAQINDSGITTYKINRLSVAKHMPIGFAIDPTIQNTDDAFVEIPYSESMFDEKLNASMLDEGLRINTTISKTITQGPKDKVSGKKLYDNIFIVDCHNYVHLGEILNHYEPLYVFNSSILDLQEHYYNIEDVIYNSSIIIDDLSTRIHSNIHSEQLNDNISFVQYRQNHSGEFVFDTSIQVQDISIENIIRTISLDVIVPKNSSSNIAKKWVINYDLNDAKITYLKDCSNANEGPYDFVNILHNNKNIFGESEISIITNKNQNNKFYCVQADSSILVKGNENIVFNSSNVYIDGEKNYIFNSCKNTSIYGNNNQIYNSDSSIVIANSAKNNVIINCTDCSIQIEGNNNYIANLNGRIFTLSGDNNILIGDNTSSVDTISLRNTRLFLDDSMHMAKENLELQNNATLFGSSTNTVDVYAYSFRTIK